MKKIWEWYKKQKVWVKILCFAVLLIPVIIKIIAILTRNKTMIFDKDDFIQIDDNPDETQVLPDTPDLDNTIDDIMNDIRD